jgi:hypothetical protein
MVDEKKSDEKKPDALEDLLKGLARAIMRDEMANAGHAAAASLVENADEERTQQLYEKLVNVLNDEPEMKFATIVVAVVMLADTILARHNMPTEALEKEEIDVNEKDLEDITRLNRFAFVILLSRLAKIEPKVEGDRIVKRPN